MKKRKWIYPLCVGVSGVLVMIGLYFSIILAGIPYQDPTPKMIQDYNFKLITGELLICVGGIVFLGSTIWRVFLWVIDRVRHH